MILLHKNNLSVFYCVALQDFPCVLLHTYTCIFLKETWGGVVCVL